MYNIEDIKEYLQSNLSSFRYKHSLLVAKEATSLAHHYNLDEKKAYLTGIIHDIAKEFTDEENKYYIEKYNIDESLLTNDIKPALHSYIGSLVIKEKFNMDEEICNAVKYHTLGHVNMTLFDKIILVSDKLGREDTDIKLKELAYSNIDKAVIYILTKQKNKLESKGLHLYRDTQELLNKLECMV